MQHLLQKILSTNYLVITITFFIFPFKFCLVNDYSIHRFFSIFHTKAFMTLKIQATAVVIAVLASGCASPLSSQGNMPIKSSDQSMSSRPIAVGQLDVPDRKLPMKPTVIVVAKTPEPSASVKPVELPVAVAKVAVIKVAAAVIAPVPKPPVEKPLAIILPTWEMTVGHTVGQDLQAWGVTAGWKVMWNLPRDWAVPADSHFVGDFPSVASEVIETLAANGALIHAQFFSGNKILVVSGPGVTPQ